MNNTLEMQMIQICLDMKKIRTDNKLSLDMVGELSDIPKSAISKYERGVLLPKVTTLQRWANVLGHTLTIAASPVL